MTDPFPSRPTSFSHTAVSSSRTQSIVQNEFGYATIKAPIVRIRERAANIRLAILEVIMPKKNGIGVYEELRKVRPDLKAVFMSGCTADIISEKGLPNQDILFLDKPVAPHVLLKKVRTVLERQT